jgi:putative DNA primase/helicase
MLMQSSRGRGSATPDLARLPGSRFVAAVETGEGRRLDEPLVKQLTGGDRIAARRLYKDVFEFTPTHKLWLATNHLPQIAGTDDAIWRRIRLIPFTVRIPDTEKDPQLRSKLLAELPGILAWAIEGCSSYLVDGLEPPASVTGATQAYRDDMDELGAFIEECCLVEDGEIAKAQELLTIYGYWAQANSAGPITATALSRALIERGFTKGRSKEGVFYKGLGVSRADQARLN